MMYQAWLDWKKDAKAGDKFTIPGTQIEAFCDRVEGDDLWITLRGEGEVRVFTYRYTSDKPTFFDMLRSLGWKDETEIGKDAEELLKLLETEGYLTLKGELEVLQTFLIEVAEGKRESFSLYIERDKVEAEIEDDFIDVKRCRWKFNGTALGESLLKLPIDLTHTAKIWFYLKRDYKKARTEATTEMDQGLRYSSGKNRLDLIPCSLIDGVGRVLTFGAQKYAPDNWRKFNQQQVKECIGSAMRHIEQYRQGNWLDPESGLPHLAHAATNLGFILELHKEEK